MWMWVTKRFSDTTSQRYRSQGKSWIPALNVDSISGEERWLKARALKHVFNSLWVDTDANWSAGLSLLGWCYGFWHIWFRLLPLLHTLQLLRQLWRLRVLSCPLRGAGVTCRPCEELEGINAARRQQLLLPLHAEHTRKGTTDSVHVFSPITAAGPEQLRALLHLRGGPEGSLPEYCADHPGEWSFFVKSSQKVYGVSIFWIDELYLKDLHVSYFISNPLGIVCQHGSHFLRIFTCC